MSSQCHQTNPAYSTHFIAELLDVVCVIVTPGEIIDKLPDFICPIRDDELPDFNCPIRDDKLPDLQ